MNTFEQVNNKNVYTPLIRNKTFDYNSYLYKKRGGGYPSRKRRQKYIFYRVENWKIADKSDSAPEYPICPRAINANGLWYKCEIPEHNAHEDDTIQM